MASLLIPPPEDPVRTASQWLGEAEALARRNANAMALASADSNGRPSVRMVLLKDGLPWFDQFRTPRAVYDILLHDEELMSRLWGFGRPRSPRRQYLLGYTARAAGMHAEAAAYLTEVTGMRSFEQCSERLRSDACIEEELAGGA